MSCRRRSIAEAGDLFSAIPRTTAARSTSAATASRLRRRGSARCIGRPSAAEAERRRDVVERGEARTSPATRTPPPTSPFRSELLPDGPADQDVDSSCRRWRCSASRCGRLEQLEIEVDGQWVELVDVQVARRDAAERAGPVIGEELHQHVHRACRRAVLAAFEQHLALRVGYIYDPTPVPTSILDATLLDVNRNDLDDRRELLPRQPRRPLVYYVAGQPDDRLGAEHAASTRARSTSTASPTLFVGGRFGV